MDEPRMLTEIGPGLLAEAFPESLRGQALRAAEAISGQLERKQWTERFRVFVEGEPILIPARLRYARPPARPESGAPPLPMALCMETRSHDGFQRQRALGALIGRPEPWIAPFVVALIGEYLVEVLDDIDSGLTAPALAAVAAFAAENPDYWSLTRQRVASYWNAYYRHARPREDYVGFRLIERIRTAIGDRAGQ